MPSGLLDFLGDPVERANIRQGFMDAVNRGAIGSLLGAPVDMTNLLLNAGKAGVGYVGHKAGLLSANQLPELTENPVGGSEWFGRQMQNAGMVSDKRNPTAEAIAGLLPVSPSTSAKAVAAVGAGGVMPGLDAAATVWHGSPHVFDRFDSSKIGTGEGSQAYGHGLYVADNETTANAYRAMANNPARRQGGLKAEGAAQVALDALIQMNARQLAGGDVSKFAEMVQKRPAAFANPEAILQRIGEYEGNLAPSYLYKVDLPDEAIAKMLDYDNPVSEAQRVPLSQAALKQFGSGLSGTSGANLYKEVVFEFKNAGHPNPAQAATDWLRENGIPGIRHLDAGSRSAGQGTSNFVVFPGNEGLLTIVERNGKPIK